MLSLEHLAELAETYSEAAKAKIRSFSVQGQQLFSEAGPSIMGVINLSADSWYRESVCLSTESAVQRGCVLRAQGAAVVDVGAESTLAQARRADEALQNSKLLPVIRGL